MPEQVERAVLGKDVEPVGPDDDSGQHHTHDMGYAQLAHYYGCEENDAQHDEEYQRRGCYGEKLRYIRHKYSLCCKSICKSAKKNHIFAVIGLKVVLLYRIISRLIYFVIKISDK